VPFIFTFFYKSVKNTSKYKPFKNFGRGGRKMEIDDVLKAQGYSELEIAQAMMAVIFSDPNVKAALKRRGEEAVANLMHSSAVLGANALLGSRFGRDHDLSNIPKAEQVAFLLNEAPGQDEGKREIYAIAWARHLLEMNPDDLESLLGVFLGKSKASAIHFLRVVTMEAAKLLYKEGFGGKEVSQTETVPFLLNGLLDQGGKMSEVYAVVCAFGMLLEKPDSFGELMGILQSKSPKASLRLSTIYLMFIW
jgi:hypothetical protein